MPPTLYHLPESPYSEKARWALDHHGVTYKSVVHVPMLYEPVLRIASRQPRKKATVPMLVDGARVLRDSLAIARYAEEHRTHATPLFPAAYEAEIVAWNERVERMLGAGRTRLMERLLASPAALVDSIPPPLSKLGSTLLPVARAAARFIVVKHHTGSMTQAEAQAVVAGVMETADARLAHHPHLVGDAFTFADLAFAAALGMVKPHPRQPLKENARVAWTEPELAAAFPRVIAWRDETMEKYR